MALINSSSELEFEINVLEYDVDAYLLIVEYNKENVSIDIKVRYLHRNDIKDKVCEIKFNGKKNLEEFIMAFKFFLVMLKYSASGDSKYMNKNIRKIIDKEYFWI